MVIQHRSILCDSKLALVSRGRAEVSRDGLCLYRYSVTITESSRDSPGRKSQGSISDLTSHARRGDCPSFTVYPVFRFPLSFSLSSSYITPPFPAPRISSLEEVNGVKLTVGSSVSWAGAPALEGGWVVGLAAPPRWITSTRPQWIHLVPLFPISKSTVGRRTLPSISQS